MITFRYLNHRKLEETRVVTPLAMLWLHNPGEFSSHLKTYKPGLFLECLDHNRDFAIRHFALYNIIIRPDEIIRWPLPHDLSRQFGMPMAFYEDTEKREAYGEGFKAGHSNELFDFDRTTSPTGPAWATGYNDGRRVYLNETSPDPAY